MAASGVNNNTFGGYDYAVDPFIKPRGAFPLDYCMASAPGQPSVWLVVSDDPDTLRTAYITFTVEEPLLLSPFLFGHPDSNSQGFYGIQNMSFNINLGEANRVWRHSDQQSHATNWDAKIESVSIHKVEESYLQFTYLSCHPSQSLTPRCIVPFYELSRYVSTHTGRDVPALNKAGFANYGTKPIASKGTYNSSTISLNQIPDKLIVYLRKPTQNWKDGDTFFPITKVNINWNNCSGVCSSFSQRDLWTCSVEAGSNQTWDEFRGYAYKGLAYRYADNTAGIGAGQYVPTCGSVLMLDMGTHVNIIEDFYAAGYIGNFTLQMQVEFENWSEEKVAPELVIMTMNSGCFATEKGTSSRYTALLTKDDVLTASQMESVSHSDANRMVGSGKFLDGLKSVFRWIGNNHKAIGSTVGNVARTGLAVNDIYNDGARKGRNDKARAILSTVGAGRSGGGSNSGGSLMARLR